MVIIKITAVTMTQVGNFFTAFSTCFFVFLDIFLFAVTYNKFFLKSSSDMLDKYFSGTSYTVTAPV